MRKLSSLLLLLMMASPVWAEDEDKPKEEAKSEAHQKAVAVLEKADAATKAVSLVRYDAEFEATGAAASRTYSGTGGVVLGGESETGLGKYRIEAKMKRPGSEDVLEYTVGSDGENHFLIDPSEKMVYVDIDPEVVGEKGGNARVLIMREYVHPKPFSDEINAEEAEILDTVKIGDTECYKIHVIYAGGQGEANWYFGKEDYLPRRVDRIFRRGNDVSEAQLTITKLDVNPSFLVSPFKLIVPDGYEKTDDFAP